jgi:hypothetical protein
MLKLVKKRPCKIEKYKTMAGAILNYYSILKFWKKLLLQYLCFHVFKSNVLNGSDENLLNYGTIVSGGHLEFRHHFVVLFLKNIFFPFYGLDYQNMSLNQL